MAFQFCTNDFYLYAETEPADPGQTQVTSESESEPSDSTGEAAEETPPSDIGTPEPSAPVEEQPAAPVEEQPVTPVEEQPDVASTLKVEFVDANNASVKETVEQALTSKYVGKTINLDELGIDINVEGYTLTEVKDKNDNTKVYTTETKDFVLTGNVTELQFVYTQNVQTDQPEDSQEPSTPQGGQEDQEDVQTVEEKAKDLANTVITMARLLQQNSHETIKVSIKGVSEEEDFDLPVGVIADNAPSFQNYTYEYATLGEDGPRVVAVGVYKIGDQTFEYYSTDGQSAQLIGENSVVLHYSKNALDIEYIVSSDQAGTITGPDSAQEGSNVSFVVKPALGYRTTDVKVNGDSIYVGAQEVYTFEMPNTTVKVEATFEKADSYTVTFNPLGNSADYDHHNYLGANCQTPSKEIVQNGDTLTTYIYTNASGDGRPLQYVVVNGQRIEVNNSDASATVDGMDISIVKKWHTHSWISWQYFEITIQNVQQDIQIDYFIKDERGTDERTIQIDALGEGIELYVKEESSDSLRPVSLNDVFTLGSWGSEIYFYAKAEQGYQVASIEGSGVTEFSNILEVMDSPGAAEAYANGCQWELHFTRYTWDNPNRSLSIQAIPTKYTVTYDAVGGSPTPVDDNVYSITEGSNRITLADAPNKEGYVFICWKLGESTYNAGDIVTIDTDLLNLADGNNIFNFTAQWKEANKVASYKVEYYKETKIGEYPSTPELKMTFENANVGDTAIANANPSGLDIKGYVLDTTHEEFKATGEVTDDDGLVLKVFYALDSNGNGKPDKDEYVTLTFESENGFDGTQGNRVVREKQVPGLSFQAPTPTDTEDEKSYS